MNYNYTLDMTLVDGEERKDLSALGEKKDGKPVLIVNSHSEMTELLAVKTLGDRSIKPDALWSIIHLDRTKFFDWQTLPAETRENLVTPYTFVAVPFMNGQTIPSAHMVLGQVSTLDVRRGQRVLEIGAGAGYTASIIACTAGNTTKVFSTEIDAAIAQYATKNLCNVGLESQVQVLNTTASQMGFINHAPYDRITTTLALRTTAQVESLLDQLNANGIMRISIAKKGNFKEKEKSIAWEPGLDIDREDLYLADSSKGFYRVSSFIFKAMDGYNVSYAPTSKGALGPMLVEPQ